MAKKKIQRTKPDVIYVRMKKETADRLREHAATRGYPHTITSVATEMIERGLDANDRDAAKAAIDGTFASLAGTGPDGAS